MFLIGWVNSLYGNFPEWAWLFEKGFKNQTGFLDCLKESSHLEFLQLQENSANYQLGRVLWVSEENSA